MAVTLVIDQCMPFKQVGAGVSTQKIAKFYSNSASWN